jgi:acyl transferase domain-containing protein
MRQAAVLMHGAALNQDGRSSSLTAPNGPAQQALIRAALQTAHMPPAMVHAAHLHGTGTPLGDPIEMGAVAAVLLAKGRGASSPLALAAHKSSAGHAEAGAGVIGLACATLTLEAGCLAPILHLRCCCAC